ncbi:phosphatidylserine/phosphatidylglycerophosphate/cardiolipin synthase family protein [Anaeromyxobacter sp. Fw109-5]|uniref:phospholipase D-like domain-containing protein n=1 Tax=Anaeromyxobacter sp. (strain Fw109-5) TaxID=404589 RepID=UPI0000ED717F|nr:phosphatidylserine/phosphatidylglycerophosphate/cardiolipin synthase family protein [Anaeromyxobacter sp. Fw109-5]ABS27619.1 phospholipase D/Transphosphatidylase [Anaeromyxobacter sp. Fw109-5]
MRTHPILAGLALGTVGVAVGGHLTRRLRRAQLSRRMLRYAEQVPLDVLLEREVGVPVRGGNAIELIEDGAVFDALEEEIRNAREHIHVCEFMWMGKGNPSARIGKAILERRRGVTCRIVLDWFGSKRFSEPRFDPELERRLVASGVELRTHLPWPDPFRLSHRRIFVFDGRTALVGGFGIWKSWLGDGNGPDEWRDTSCRVRGPIVSDLQRAFDHSLQAAGGEPLPGSAYPRQGRAGDCHAAVVASTPKWARTTTAARMYYALIASARRRLYVANSYFVPDRSLQHVLVARAKAGVDVRVLAPGPHHDQPLVRAGQRRTYSRLLRGGVRIWEYGASMMHAKTLVADDVAVIGSTNMDSQSLSFLWETSVVCDAPPIARRIVERYELDLERSSEIRLEAWRRRPLRMQLGEQAAGITEPWL